MSALKRKNGSRAFPSWWTEPDRFVTSIVPTGSSGQNSREGGGRQKVRGSETMKLRTVAVILAFGVWWALPGAQTALVTRGPYLQQDTARTIVVRWRTSVPTDSRVLYGPASENLIWAADDATVTTEHAVLVPALVGGTTYFYSVGTTTENLAGGDARADAERPLL